MALSSSAQRLQDSAAKRKAERQGTSAPAPAPVARPKTVQKPSTRATPPASSGTPPKPVTPLKSPPKVTATGAVETAASPAAIDPLLKGKENAQTFMGIIGSMPPETRTRYLSAFTDFLALPIDQQAAYLSGLEQQAKDIVAPQINQTRERLTEDFEYEKSKRDREKSDLQATFNKIVTDMDFNKNRDIAKENETAAKVMQNIGNTAFVTGVAGSGIFSRRTAYVRESRQNAVDDVNIDYNQKTGQLALSKSQKDRELDAEIDRLTNLNTRDLTDLDQTQKQDELSLFLELAGNKFGAAGQQNTQLLEAGAGSAAEDSLKGGTDNERKARFNREKQQSLKEAEAARIAADSQREMQAADQYFSLRNLETALKSLNRTSEVQALQPELQRLRGFATSAFDRALKEGSSFQGGIYGQNSGYRLDDIEQKKNTDFLGSLGLLYTGMNSESRKRADEYVQKNLGLLKTYIPSTP